MFCNLAAEQARKNMTDQQIADYIGISRQAYSNKKRNGKFYVAEISKLCDLFDCTYEYLFFENNKSA